MGETIDGPHREVIASGGRTYLLDFIDKYKNAKVILF
jgi:hypothetical protein